MVVEPNNVEAILDDVPCASVVALDNASEPGVID